MAKQTKYLHDYTYGLVCDGLVHQTLATITLTVFPRCLFQDSLYETSSFDAEGRTLTIALSIFAFGTP